MIRLLAGLIVLGGVVWGGVASADTLFYLTAKLQWDWQQGEGDPATKFVLRCGTTAGGPYDYTKEVPVTQFELPMREVVPGRGTYYCVATAADDDGTESEYSNEANAHLLSLLFPPFSLRLE